MRPPLHDVKVYIQPFIPVAFRIPGVIAHSVRVTPLKNMGLLLVSVLFRHPARFYLVDIYTGKVIGSLEIPGEATVARHNLNIRDRERDYVRFIEDKIRILQLSIDEEGLIPYIREVLGDDELARSIAERTGFSGVEDLL